MNLRHWKSYEAVACTIADTLKTLGVDALAMPDGADLIERLRAERIGLVRGGALLQGTVLRDYGCAHLGP